MVICNAEPVELMLIVYACEAEAPALSVTVTVKVKEPADDGVPLIAPDEFSARPAGSEPALTEKLSGEVPPDAPTVCE